MSWTDFLVIAGAEKYSLDNRLPEAYQLNITNIVNH
jgi:hypothetical protein